MVQVEEHCDPDRRCHAGEEALWLYERRATHGWRRLSHGALAPKLPKPYGSRVPHAWLGFGAYLSYLVCTRGAAARKSARPTWILPRTVAS